MIRTVSSSICMVPVREGRTALTRSDLPRLGRLGALAFAAAVGAVAITLLAAMIVAFIALKQAAPGMATSVADQGTDVPLDGAIRVSPGGWLAHFESATLWEAPQEGRPRPTEIPLQVELLRQGWLPGQTQLTVRPAAGPRPVEGAGPLTAEIGKPLAIRWNVPVDHLKWEISPPLPGDWQFDSQDRSLSQLRLDGLAQDTTYRLTVHEAVAENGAPLAE